MPSKRLYFYKFLCLLLFILCNAYFLLFFFTIVFICIRLPTSSYLFVYLFPLSLTNFLPIYQTVFNVYLYIYKTSCICQFINVLYIYLFIYLFGPAFLMCCFSVFDCFPVFYGMFCTCSSLINCDLSTHLFHVLVCRCVT